MEEITLDWSNLIPIKNLKYNKPVRRGVYVWGFIINEKFVPYYVGEANDIDLRIQEHITLLLSGRYTINHKDCLDNISKFKNSEVSELGKVYEPKWPTNYNSFIANRERIQVHLDFMVKSFAFQYAEVPLEKADKLLLKLIENECIIKLNKDNLANKKGSKLLLTNVIHHNLKSYPRL